MESSTAIEHFEALVSPGLEPFDLALAALTAAAALGEEVNVELEETRLDDVADEARKRLAEAEGPLGQINALNETMFDELGFAGNTDDYYDPRNSLLNQVIERRRGIPITLSLVYIEVGARAGIPLVGVGMPGHFLVKHESEDSLFVDPYHRGVIRDESECIQQFSRINEGMHWDPAFLSPVAPRSLLARMLRNLGAIWTQREELALAERVLTLLMVLQPGEAGHKRDRGMLRFRLGQRDDALTDLEAYLDPRTSAPDMWYVRRIVDRIQGGEEA
ncbi:MAG: transglutaminase-like domain-containing protein [Chloroflexi bacterium]|nr:transglutaminase-like domain-containing protein [Chloroflexota bacterium]